MKRLTVLAMALPLLVACQRTNGGAPPESLEIELLSPEQGAEVGHQELVRGKVSGGDARIYVLVHPLLTNLWWVQRPPSPPNRDGTWQTVAYLGTENEGEGESFEIVAIATSRVHNEGDTLAGIPPDAKRSDIVTVRRAR